MPATVLLSKSPTGFPTASTVPVTASGHTVSFLIQQPPNVAAMRWNGGCTPGMGVSLWGASPL